MYFTLATVVALVRFLKFHISWVSFNEPSLPGHAEIFPSILARF